MYTKRTKLIGMILAVIMLMQVVLPTLNVYAIEGNKNEITFVDENLYTAIKETLAEKIKESNDDTKTVVFDNINAISELNLSTKNIMDLGGIGGFEGLTKLDLSTNNIRKINDLENLKQLEDLNLSNNHIEDCTVLEKLPLLKNISLGSEDLEKVVIINAKDIKKREGVTSFEYTLPQIFKYIYDKEPNSSYKEPKLEVTKYTGIEGGLEDNNQYTVENKNNKLIINRIKNPGMATIELAYGKNEESGGIGHETCLVLHIVAITDEGKCGIKFEDENLYNAVKANIEGTKTATPPYSDSKYTTIRDDDAGCIWYDDILTLVINKHYLYKDITDLDLVNKQIKNIEGLQYFVALSNLNLSNNFISDIQVLKDFAEEKANAEKDLKSILKVKIDTLTASVEKKEDYNNLLSKKGKEKEVNKKIKEITDYIENLKEEQISNEDKSDLKTYFSDNLQINKLVSSSLEDNTNVTNLLNASEATIGEIDINSTTYQYKATISNGSIKGIKHETTGGSVTSTSKEINLGSEIIDAIKNKISDIQKINNGKFEQEGTWVDINEKRNEIVTAIGTQIDSIEKYYDIENLLLILPKEYLEYEDIELNNLSLYEKRVLASNIIEKFIDKYDTLTVKEIENAGSITKVGLETIKSQITDAIASVIENIITNYIGKQREILTETYTELYESATISYDNYIIKALEEISDDYINGSDDVQAKDVKSIISRMKNVDTEETVSLPKIKHVDLSSNSIQDISELTDMTTLLSLNLCDNLISDLSTTDFTKFEKLYELDLSHNRIYNTQIGSIKNLINLNLSNNYITNTEGMDFKLFDKLQKIDLSGNRIYDLKSIMFNLYELSKKQENNEMKSIITWTNPINSFSPSADFKEFGYRVDISKVNFKGQQIWATAKNKIVQDKVEYIHLPEIFNQAKYIDSFETTYSGGTSTVTDLNNTTFLYAKATNDGMVLYLDTGRLGEQSNSASIEGTEIAAGTTCTVRFTVATQAEIDETLATGVQIQLEKTLADNENAYRPDFNKDGKVNSDDLNILNKVFLSSQTISEELSNIAKNIVPDNILDIKDQLLLSKYVSTGWDDGKLTDEQREKAEVADITGDDKVENDDSIVLANYLIGGVYAPYTEAQIIAKFDINGDGNVNEKDAICLSRYLVSKSTEKINIDTLTLEMLNDYKQSKQLHAKISPDNTKQKDIEWVSHDERIVRVDSNGTVTAVGTGTTQITAKSTKNPNVYDTISVTVSIAADIAENIAIKDINNLKTEYYVGQEIDLTNSKVVITKRSGQEVELDITKEMIKGFDTATQTTEPRIITVEYTDEFGTTVQTSFTITVVPFVGEDTVNSIILVPPTKLEYNKGEDLDLTGSTVEKVMESGIKQEAVPTTVEMISGYDKTVPGEQVVTVTYAEKTATFNVMVNNPVTGVSLDKTEESITNGGTIKLNATVNPEDAVNKNVTWSSSDASIATVDSSGNVTAVDVGETIITVTTVDGGKTATCKIIVKDNIYEIGEGYIAKISPSTNEAEFLDKLNSNKNCRVVKSDGVTVLAANEKIATGYKLVEVDNNGTRIAEISTLVVKGDINCDGDVDGTDATAIIYHINGKKEITNDIQLIAADVDRDGIIDMTDYTRIIYHFICIGGYIL